MTTNSSVPVLEHRDAKTEGGDPLSTEQVTEKPTLDTLIRQALRGSLSPDPVDSIDTVMSTIDPGDYAYYLRQAIVSRLAANVSKERTSATPLIRTTGPGRSAVSTKQALIRDQYWPMFLRQRILVGVEHKFLGDATIEDLRAVSAQRRVQADELMTRSRQFESLAVLMESAGVDALRDLDSSAALEVLGRAA